MRTKYIEPDFIDSSTIVSERKSPYGLRTYISLFSSAGIGCYGFKEEGYFCVATVEIIERRLKIQQYNQKCAYKSGYICGDMTSNDTKEKVFKELNLWKDNFGVEDLDVIIATPPCQGMSVANHKKKDELGRNSLVVESIKMVKDIRPKFFVFENVSAFLKSTCTDIDGQDKKIRDAIDCNLAGLYNIYYKVINFKDYGNPSSRTRTLVLGSRKDLKEVTPLDLFPDKQQEKTLRETIGHLPSLKKMGEIDPNDIFHSFREYAPQMEAWISDIKEGQSAFDNDDPQKIPHKIVDGIIIYNAKKNGDKYTRQYWDKVAPCIHTRNDILASQNTVHPADNRVFSVRELMLMMSIPASFKWTDVPFEVLNKMSESEKRTYIKKEDVNIRQTIGEAVPTIIFRQIAHKIKIAFCQVELTEKDVEAIIKKRKLYDMESLKTYIEKADMGFPMLSKIAELANAERENNAAYYTRQDLCFAIIQNLPDAKQYSKLNILEPSIGVGNFLPILINKYKEVPVVNIDVVDIDNNSIEILKLLVNKLDVPQNININYITADFLTHTFDKEYDIVVGNPPYKKITNEKTLLAQYRKDVVNKDTNNIFSFFIEKAVKIGKIISFIVPKSLINAPEFDKTRDLMNQYSLTSIIDFGEKGFKGVKIETINFTLNTKKRPSNTRIESYITNDVRICEQAYITSNKFPYWLIYRNEDFDKVVEKMDFNIFSAYRDRKITKTITKSTGKVRVLKSRNIGDNQIIDIPGYDCFVDQLEGLDVVKYMNDSSCILVPNLTYYPRATRMPVDCVADGSVAILQLLDSDIIISDEDLKYYATEEYTKFYTIARNRGTRSLNIDNNSVFFFGKLKSH